MNLFKNILNFYVNSSIHVALAVYSLVRITELYFDLPYNENLDYFIFYATITGYNFIKYAGVAKFYHRSLTKSMRLIQIFSFLSFCLLVYYGSNLSTTVLIYFIPFAVLTLVYVVPFLGGFQKNLRRVSYLKIFLVAFVWSGVTTVIPLIVGEYQYEVNIILLFVQRMLFILVLILPFEIRDMEHDSKDLKTIPQLMGIKNSKRLAYLLIAVFYVLSIENFSINFLKESDLLISILLILIIYITKKNQSKYFASFWVESVPVYWILISLILN